MDAFDDSDGAVGGVLISGLSFGLGTSALVGGGTGAETGALTGAGTGAGTGASEGASVLGGTHSPSTNVHPSNKVQSAESEAG